MSSSESEEERPWRPGTNLQVDVRSPPRRNQDLGPTADASPPTNRRVRFRVEVEVSREEEATPSTSAAPTPPAAADVCQPPPSRQEDPNLADASLPQQPSTAAGVGLPPARKDSNQADVSLPQLSKQADASLPPLSPAAGASLPPLPLMSLALPSCSSSASSLRPTAFDPVCRPHTAVSSETRLEPAKGQDVGAKRRKIKKLKPNVRPCPICGVVPTQYRTHIEWQHLPYWLHLEASCLECKVVFDTPAQRADHTIDTHLLARNEEHVAARWLVAARNLLQLIAELAARPLEELHLWVREQGWQTDASVAFGAPQAALLRDLAVFIGLRLSGPEELSPSSVSHPVAILHWRILSQLAASQDAAGRMRLQFVPFPSDDDEALSEVPDPPVVDAHCHLTTLLATTRTRGEDCYEEGPFTHAGVIDNRVFPHEWRRPLPPGCQAGFGVHPSVAGSPNFDWDSVKDEFAGFPIIGECGLDEVRGPMQQQSQERIFRLHIRMALATEKPLVLHLRGDLPTFYRAKTILEEERTPATQRLYIHCFVGDMALYELWVRRFPRTVFGVSPITARTRDCDEFCRRADLSRIVLESDAPYLGRKAYDVLVQASHIAALRHICVRAVLGATAQTAALFFPN